jgi:hypothetical protein
VLACSRCSLDRVTDGDPGRADLADEAGWTSIPDEDEVWAGPTRLPPPLVDPAPSLLNTHEMDWESFERLVLAMARRLDGAYDARRFGRPGQAQHGLDVVAFFAERAPSAYQAKRWQDFDESDLEQAVELYFGGRRPFGADRIVIAVATEVRDAKTLEKLAALRGKHQDMRIELWDKQAISDRLRNDPNLVTTFFGAATAAAFCTNTPPPAAAAGPAPPIAADAVLRGPIAHLGLDDDLRRAEEAVPERPAEAAALLAGIADRLEASPFGPHAAPVRELLAKALRAAGRRADEAWVRIDLGWHQLDAGDTFSAGLQVREIANWGDDAPEDVMRCADALSAAAGVRRERAVTLGQLAEAVDRLADDDAHRVDAALVLAEEAIAARRPELVNARADVLRDLAAGVPQNNEGQLIAARLRMCVADAGDGWEELAATARETYPPAVTALVLARHARHLALVPQPEPSVARWRDAIERACLEGLNDDAADWLYALRGVRLQHGLIANDINDLHRHAQALRAAGSGTLLPEPYRARERALASLRDQKWPDALEALRRYLWRSVVGADWSGEVDAHELLGDLFSRTGRAEEAIQHYSAAGQRKKLEQLAAQLRDEPVRLPIDLITPRPWERAAAFSFAAACADVMVDDDARRWCTAALHEIVHHPQPAPILAPNPWLAAFKAFGQLAVVSTVEQARRFLEISRELIPREPNRYRLTDEDQVHAIIGIARAHPDLRAEAIEQLFQAVLLDSRMAEFVLRNGHDLLRDDPSRTVSAVGEAAVGGNHYAALALVAAEEDTTQAIPLAHQRLESAVAPRAHEPGVRTFGTGLSQTAALATVLPEEDRVRFAHGMLEFANDREETSLNRYEALIALQGITRYVPDEVRDELFEQVLPFAEGRHDADREEFFAGADDPFQRFRLSLGEESLAPGGLMAAAALARTREQYVIVERIAVALIQDATDQTANAIAVALASLPPEELTLPVQLLASHPSQWLRALAAVIWAQRPDRHQEVGVALAHDTSPHVRGSLARSLRDDARHAEVRAVLTDDPRRSVRQRVKRDS